MKPETIISTNLFYAAFFSYGSTLLFYLVSLGTGKDRLQRPAVVFMAGAFVLHSLGIVSRTLEFHHLPLANMFEYLLVTSWFAALASFFVLKFTKNLLVASGSVMLIVMFMLALSLLPKEGSSALMPALRSCWLYIHVSAAAASEGLFAIGFVSSALCLLKSLLPPSSPIREKMPDRTVFDRLTYRMIITGYLLFTLGALFAGSIWAHRAWGSFWSWDPKETCSLVVWIIYSVYLHARLKGRPDSPAPHLLSIAGFIAALLTFLSSMFIGGMHSYG